MGPKAPTSASARSITQLRAALDAIAGDFQWGINTVINQDTIGDLDALVAVAAEHGASGTSPAPGAADRRTTGANEETLRVLQNWVAAYTVPVPLSTSAQAELGVSTADALPKEVGLRSYAHIDASGTARASSYAASGVRIGEDGVIAALQQLAKAEAA